MEGYNLPDSEPTLKPIYNFEWENGAAERDTSNLDADAAALEALASFGREDDECTVTVIGYSA